MVEVIAEAEKTKAMDFEFWQRVRRLYNRG